MANLNEAYVKSALPLDKSITTGGEPSKYESFDMKSVATGASKMNGGKKNKSKKGGRHSKSKHSKSKHNKSKHNKSKKGGKKQKNKQKK